jgi:hypothetical protein
MQSLLLLVYLVIAFQKCDPITPSPLLGMLGTGEVEGWFPA